ncbi:unnamed protein product [Notodromas monacha]|uniref:Uncharacterized protein n=1 Tax=Notodromas monacha TaxID=399045 RepID=A0A7R9BRV4_9CRUS|nr:unnamed protein product [Notodromas monacha]CAG0920536.1 unnamed protein product [Notodromas monacha]
MGYYIFPLVSSVLSLILLLGQSVSGNDDSMRICYRVNGQPMTCAANTMCFTAYEDFRRAGNVVAKGCMTYLSPGCVNCPQSLMKHFPTGNNGPEKLPKLCCYCDFDGCNAEGIKFSSSIAAGLWASSPVAGLIIPPFPFNPSSSAFRLSAEERQDINMLFPL